MAAVSFPKNCGSAAVLAVALSSLVVRLFFGCGYAAAPNDLFSVKTSVMQPKNSFGRAYGLRIFC